MTLKARIPFYAEQCGDSTYVRGMRIRVADIVEILAKAVTLTAQLVDVSDLESEDICVCLYLVAQSSATARPAARNYG